MLLMLVPLTVGTVAKPWATPGAVLAVAPNGERMLRLKIIVGERFNPPGTPRSSLWR